MWIPNDIVTQVDAVAVIYYIDFAHCQRWNMYRKANELRLLSGYVWLSRSNPNVYRYGLKTKTAAYRDAWYELVKKSKQPSVTIRLQNRKQDGKAKKNKLEARDARTGC